MRTARHPDRHPDRHPTRPSAAEHASRYIFSRTFRHTAYNDVLAVL